MVTKVALILLLCLLVQVSFAKNRIIILTDIHRSEPDDAETLIRFLTYSNEFDVEGIIATTSFTHTECSTELIHPVLDEYAKVRDNLQIHADQLGIGIYPTASFLKSLVNKGPCGRDISGDRANNTFSVPLSPGGQMIIDSALKNDNRPIWVVMWGGANTFAQALFYAQKTRNTQQMNSFVSKFRVYAIEEQDVTGPWLRQNYPNLFYISSPRTWENGQKNNNKGIWMGFSGEFKSNVRQFEVGADYNLVTNAWILNNIKNNHGPLGAHYPTFQYLMEGDTPSFIYLVDNGLNSPENPHYGGWGGRYIQYKPNAKFYNDSIDTLVLNGRTWSDKYTTIWRWREAYQNDFAARIDWTHKTFSQVNHPPVPHVPSTEITVGPGQTVNLDASASTDPDGNALTFTWILYREPTNIPASDNIVLTPNGNIATIVVPNYTSEKSIHVILQVNDNGSPKLFRYKRIIITVKPGSGSQPTSTPTPKPTSVPTPKPTSKPTSTPTQSPVGSFHLGINVGGSTGVTIDGKTWKSQQEAVSSGFSVISSGAQTDISSFTPVPATSAGMETMLNSVMFVSSNNIQFGQTITNGNYFVNLFVMENYRANNRRFNIKLEGDTVVSNVGSLELAAWETYGPYLVTISDGNLNIELVRVSGTPHLMGIEIFSQQATPSPTPKPTYKPTIAPTPKPTISPTPKPTSSPSFVFILGVNIGGSASVVINGNTWKSQSQAVNSGFGAPSNAQTANTNVTPVPTPSSSDITTMLNTGMYVSYSGIKFTQTIPNGSYQVYLWIMENHSNNNRNFNVKLESTVVATSIGSLELGEYNNYGPYNVIISDGVLDIELIRISSTPHLMGLEIYSS